MPTSSRQPSRGTSALDDLQRRRCLVSPSLKHPQSWIRMMKWTFPSPRSNHSPTTMLVLTTHSYSHAYRDSPWNQLLQLGRLNPSLSFHLLRLSLLPSLQYHHHSGRHHLLRMHPSLHPFPVAIPSRKSWKSKRSLIWLSHRSTSPATTFA
jgi:hypothetical protein